MVTLLFDPIGLNWFLYPGTGHSNHQSPPPGAGARGQDSKCGIAYMPDNEPETIASTLTTVIGAGKWKQNATQYVRDTHNPDAVSKSLETLLQQVAPRRVDCH